VFVSEVPDAFTLQACSPDERLGDLAHVYTGYSRVKIDGPLSAKVSTFLWLISSTAWDVSGWEKPQSGLTAAAFRSPLESPHLGRM
jgi:hypothetical protein